MSYILHYCPDSFAYIKTCEDKCVDVIITDPPYSQHVHDNLCSGSLVGTKNVPKYELPFQALEGYTWLADAVRITKRWVISFCDLEAFGLIKQAHPDAYVRGCVWAKKNAMGQLTGDRPATAFEGIACLHGPKATHEKKRWNGKGSYGIWSCNGTRGKKDRHPNEKPIDLALKLVALFSERGETVFDPFCGSGVIGEACMRLGRQYIGFDKDWVWKDNAGMRVCNAHPWVTDDYALSLCKMWGKDAED